MAIIRSLVFAYLFVKLPGAGQSTVGGVHARDHVAEATRRDTGSAILPNQEVEGLTVQAPTTKFRTVI